MSKIFGLSLFFLSITLGSISLKAQATTLKPRETSSLQEVRRIYVDRMGSAMKDVEFVESSCKAYLEDQQRNNCRMTPEDVKVQRNNFYRMLPYLFEDFGFQIVSKLEEADAIMSLTASVQKRCGGLTYSSHWGNRPAGFYVETIGANLSSFGGKKIWSAVISSRGTFREGTILLADKLRNSKYKPIKVRK